MKKVFFLISIIFFSFSMTGCWSSVQPKNLAIINSGIYDIGDDNNYLLTIQILNASAIGSSQSGGGTRSAGITLNTSGETFTDAFHNVSTSLERKLFADHNKVRFLTEKFATKDFAVINLFDFIMRSNLVDETSLVVVLRDADKDKLFKTTLGLSNTVGNFLDDISKMQPAISSRTAFIDTLQFITDCFMDGKQPVAGIVSFQETDEIPSLNNGLEADDIKYKLIYEGLAVFKDYKLVGYMNAEETEIYNILTKKAKVMNLNLRKGNDYCSVEYNKPRCKIKASLDGEKAIINLKFGGSLHMKKMLVEGVNKANYQETIDMLEIELSNVLKEQAVSAIKKAQEYGSDIYGFGASLHAQHPKDWANIRQDWESFFKNATINVECELKISNDGEINEPFWGK